MSNQRERKRGQESAGRKLKPDASNVNVTLKAGNALVDNCHVYTSTSLPLTTAEDFMDDFPLLPITPSKSPAPKKMMHASGSEQTDTNDIIASLSALINTRSDNIESMVSANALKIEGLKKTIDFVCAEIKEVKSKVCTLEVKMAKEEKRVDACQQRVSELERYSRRWNLRLYGVEESEKENIRKKVIEVCQAVLPEERNRLADTIHTVHRLGTRWQGDGRPRGIIIQFIARVCRDAVWKAAKTSPQLRDNGLRFAEDLSMEDRERTEQTMASDKKSTRGGQTSILHWRSRIYQRVRSPPTHLRNGLACCLLTQGHLLV